MLIKTSNANLSDFSCNNSQTRTLSAQAFSHIVPCRALAIPSDTSRTYRRCALSPLSETLAAPRLS